MTDHAGWLRSPAEPSGAKLSTTTFFYTGKSRENDLKVGRHGSGAKRARLQPQKASTYKTPLEPPTRYLQNPPITPGTRYLQKPLEPPDPNT